LSTGGRRKPAKERGVSGVSNDNQKLNHTVGGEKRRKGRFATKGRTSEDNKSYKIPARPTTKDTATKSKTDPYVRARLVEEECPRSGGLENRDRGGILTISRN